MSSYSREIVTGKVYSENFTENFLVIWFLKLICKSDRILVVAVALSKI